MKMYKCDWCDAVLSCHWMAIDGKNYDFCDKCAHKLRGKLEGKGEPIVNNGNNSFVFTVPTVTVPWPPNPNPGITYYSSADTGFTLTN